MKKLFTCALAALILFTVPMFTGCKSIIFTPENSYQLGYCAGITAGAVIHSKKLSPEVTDNILYGMSYARSVIPEEGRTFTETWVPLMDEYLSMKPEIDETIKNLIKTGFKVYCSALDLTVAKHPEVLDGEACIRSLADGVLNGFQFYIKPSNFAQLNRSCKSTTMLRNTPQIDYELFKALDAMTRE